MVGRQRSMNKNKCNPSILVVENDRIQQMLLKLLCQKFGYAVSIVTTGEEALCAIGTSTASYDAIVMDWKLPSMDGLDTTRAIRQLESVSGGHTPIVALTARAMVGDREKCLASGMDDYLSKPFTGE